jgi:TolB-like protein/DNA-binding winged helix-turn-helix (wHTH) protein
MAALSKAPIQVGDWVVDPDTDTITRAGRTQKLEPRMMRLLLLLADIPGAVISAERMLNEIWPGVVVSPSSVYQAISQLRRLLGDIDPEPTYIATVPRKGYRLVAPVHPLRAPDPVAHPALPPPPAPPSAAPLVATPGVALETSSRARRRGRLGVTVAAVLIGLFGAAWVLGHTYFARPAADAPPSIVVLPFLDMTQERTDQFFCDGLTEELSNWLAQVPTLRVVARTSAFAFRGQQDTREIGRQLNTTHVLEGSLRRYGDHVRVTVQLIDARSGYHLWSSEYDRQAEDTIAMQEEVARSVAESLQLRLTEDTTQRFAERRSASAQAYNLYLLALHYQAERSGEANKKAIEVYQQALARDPKFALAYVGLAYVTINERWLNGRSAVEVARTAESLLEQAQRLDPQLSEMYAVRGALRVDQLRYDEALNDLQHAVALNPNDSWAWSQRGKTLLALAQPREALDSLAHASLLDPLDFTVHARQCIALQDMARYKDAEGECARSRALEATGNFGTLASSWLEWTQGHLPQALQWNAEAQKRAPGDLFIYERRADLLLTLGLVAGARQTLEQARVATRDDAGVDLEMSTLVFHEGGAEALRAYLNTLHADAIPRAREQMQLASYYLLAGDPATARATIASAMRQPDFEQASLNDPWYARWGESQMLVVALSDRENGDSAAAEEHLNEVLTMVDRAIAAGEQRFGLFAVKAQALALRGDPDKAIQALTRAADLGWRRSWWADHEPYFASLRPRADYRALIARVDAINRQLRSQVPPTD